MPHKKSRTNVYYVYLLLCNDGSYYTGYTSKLDMRMKLHMKGHGARYTRMHPPERIVHVEEFRTRASAMKRELQIKGLSHSRKYDLIKKDRFHR